MSKHSMRRFICTILSSIIWIWNRSHPRISEPVRAFYFWNQFCAVPTGSKNPGNGLKKIHAWKSHGIKLFEKKKVKYHGEIMNICYEMTAWHSLFSSLADKFCLNNYTPSIYADGYIVFAFLFVRSYVRSFVSSFVIPERSWNLCQSFC